MVKLSTEIARELFLYGPPGGKRVTSVKELVRLAGASERTIHKHMPQWKRESEEMAANGRESGLVLCLSTATLEAHKIHVDFMRSEADRLQLHMRCLSPSDESYPAISRSYLAIQKQWALMAGIMAALDAAGWVLKETAKAKAKMEGENKPPDDEEPDSDLGVSFKRRIA